MTQQMTGQITGSVTADFTEDCATAGEVAKQVAPPHAAQWLASLTDQARRAPRTPGLLTHLEGRLGSIV